MNDETPLYLYEDLLLLALRDDKGTVATGAWANQAVAGALLAELLLERRLRLGDDGETVDVADESAIGDPLLDETLATIAATGPVLTVRKWVGKIANDSELRHRAAEGLCDRGILEEERKKVLFFLERRRYPELDGAPEARIISELEGAVLGDTPPKTPREVVRLSLAHHTGILSVVLGRKLVKEHKDDIERMIDGEAIGEAAKEVVAAIHAAILVTTCITPVIISS